MRPHLDQRVRRATLVITLVAVAGLVAPLRAQAAEPPAVAEPAFVRLPAEQQVFRDGGSDGTQSVVAAPATASLRASGAAATSTFNVNYINFPADNVAKNAFQAAVNIWASKIASTVPIRVRATWEPLGSGVLGSAGPGGFFKCNTPTGCPLRRSDTWYASALADKQAGANVAGTSPDIVASFNSSFTAWHFGSGAPPAGKYDFRTVVLHELGHGLGFLGSFAKSGGVGSWGLSDGTSIRPVSYDRQIGNGNGKRLVGGPFPNNSTALGAQLTGNDLFWRGAQGKAGSPNGKVRIYAPSTWAPGSSLGHLAENTYPMGSPHSLMTPFLQAGERILSPGAITRGILADQGW